MSDEQKKFNYEEARKEVEKAKKEFDEEMKCPYCKQKMEMGLLGPGEFKVGCYKNKECPFRKEVGGNYGFTTNLGPSLTHIQVLNGQIAVYEQGLYDGMQRFYKEVLEGTVLKTGRDGLAAVTREDSRGQDALIVVTFRADDHSTFMDLKFTSKDWGMASTSKMSKAMLKLGFRTPCAGCVRSSHGVFCAWMPTGKCKKGDKFEKIDPKEK